MQVNKQGFLHDDLTRHFMSPHVFIWISAPHNKDSNFSSCKHSVHHPWGTFMYDKMPFGIMNHVPPMIASMSPS